MHLLEVMNLSKKEGAHTLLHPISFALDKGDRLAIAGANGSGKTTLLKLMAGFIQPSTGSVLYAGKKVLGPEEKLLPGHPKIAYLSQHFELRNNYYVQELLEMASKITHEEAETVYAICKIDHLLNRKTSQLSGGERQRIALALLLTTQPDILLLDEPFSNADMHHKQQLKEVLAEIGKQLHTAMILVAHDPLDILPWADSVLILNEGKLLQNNTCKQLYHQPVNAYAAGLLGFCNEVHHTLAQQLKLPLKGTDATLVRPEKLQIQTNGNGLQATITAIAFYGNYCLVQVMLMGSSIWVFSTTSEWRIHQTVYLSLKQHV
jgi:ABC-type sugar transport system ATPase subunit